MEDHFLNQRQALRSRDDNGSLLIYLSNQDVLYLGPQATVTNGSNVARLIREFGSYTDQEKICVRDYLFSVMTRSIKITYPVENRDVVYHRNWFWVYPVLLSRRTKSQAKIKQLPVELVKRLVKVFLFTN